MVDFPSRTKKRWWKMSGKLNAAPATRAVHHGDVTGLTRTQKKRHEKMAGPRNAKGRLSKCSLLRSSLYNSNRTAGSPATCRANPPRPTQPGSSRRRSRVRGALIRKIVVATFPMGIMRQTDEPLAAEPAAVTEAQLDRLTKL